MSRFLLDPETVAAARRAPWWWADRANPACLSGCQELHDPDEFKVMGFLVCLLGTITAPSGLRMVEVAASQYAEQESVGEIRRTHAEATVLGPVDGLTARQAHELAVALSQAAVLIGSAQ